MKRDSAPELVAKSKAYKRLFQECWYCHTVGLKPGILHTRHGDYGMRQTFAKVNELPLNENGLCEVCARELNQQVKRDA